MRDNGALYRPSPPVKSEIRWMHNIITDKNGVENSLFIPITKVRRGDHTWREKL